MQAQAHQSRHAPTPAAAPTPPRSPCCMSALPHVLQGSSQHKPPQQCAPHSQRPAIKCMRRRSTLRKVTALNELCVPQHCTP